MWEIGKFRIFLLWDEEGYDVSNVNVNGISPVGLARGLDVVHASPSCGYREELVRDFDAVEAFPGGSLICDG